MSGNLQSEDEEIQRVISKLDELLEKIGLEDTHRFVNDYTKKALRMSHQELKSLHRDDLVEMAFLLRQYALNVTIDTNKCSSVINWCNARLNSQIVQADLGDVYNYELKVARVIRENEYAKKMWKTSEYYKAQKELLNNVSFSIGKMADTVENLARGR